MRQAINNLQSTHSGFGFVSPENVYKICDQPHPVKVRQLVRECQKGEIDQALARINELWEAGYSAVDIVTTGWSRGWRSCQSTQNSSSSG
jgi:replication factor C subunit 2/4